MIFHVTETGVLMHYTINAGSPEEAYKLAKRLQKHKEADLTIGTDFKNGRIIEPLKTKKGEELKE
jgi:hypothetical protein